MNEREQFWAGEFGKEYTARNRVRWHDRASFWAWVMDTTKAKHVLEVGCNAGWNLRAIKHTHPNSVLDGCEINKEAIVEAQSYHVGFVTDMPALRAGEFYSNYSIDLAFTCGVLIHIGPEELQDTLASIAKASRRWVLAVEYAAEREEEVLYRGHAGRLWKRPYGKLYEEMGLRLVAEGEAGAGFDACNFWLLEK